MSSAHHDASFNATRLARLETTAWTAYYRHEWPRVLAAAYGLVREAFNLTLLETVLGAWCVFSANVVWAPYPDNDPDRARQYMRRVYAMSQRPSKLGFDPAEAARLEVEWWRVHRARQHGDVRSSDELPEAVARLYAYIYGVDTSSRSERAAASAPKRWTSATAGWLRGATRTASLSRRWATACCAATGRSAPLSHM